MSDVILDSVKRVLYKNGSYILSHYPKCDTSKWNVSTWIMWIDEFGEWVQ